VLYLDTGCLVKLYYPEPESAAVATIVLGKAIIFTDLHELEMATAMQLKVFRGEANRESVMAAMNLVRDLSRPTHANLQSRARNLCAC